MTRYRVVDGTQVHHNEVTYAAGQVLDAQPTRAAEWLALGLVEAVEPAKAAAKRPPAE